MSLLTLSPRDTSTTLRPWSAMVSAMDLPMPVPAPVTRAHSALYFFFRSWGPPRSIPMFVAELMKAH